MALFLFLVLSVLTVLSNTQHYEPPAFKHSILFMDIQGDGEVNLQSKSEYKLFRREITSQQSRSIWECTNALADAAERNNQSNSLDHWSLEYMRCVEKNIGISIGDLSEVSLCDPGFGFWESCTRDIPFGKNFDPHYKKDYVNRLRRHNIQISTSYNQLPIVDTVGKRHSRPSGQHKLSKPVCQENVDHSGAEEVKLSTRKVATKSAELTSSTTVTAEVSASLEVSYQWLSVSASAGYSHSNTNALNKANSQVKSTDFSVSFELGANKTIYVRDQNSQVAMDRDIHVPFEATGWLVDVTGKAYKCGSMCAKTTYNNFTSAYLFPVGDMAYYFPTLMKRVNANTMVFNGPAYTLSGSTTEYIFHIKEYPSSQKRC